MSASIPAAPPLAVLSPSSPSAANYNHSSSTVEEIKPEVAAATTTGNQDSDSPAKDRNILLRWLDIPTKFFGFKRNYNFIFWFIFGGAMFFFVCLRFDRIDKAAATKFGPPGTGYWGRKKNYKTGYLLHLATILPAGLLSVFQFIPIIRYKFLLAHRISGYAIYILLIVSSAGTLMLTRRTLGGSFTTQILVVIMTAVSLISAGLAYYNIKRLQIDQHRKWMLRTMFYMGSIITARIIAHALQDVYFKYINFGEAFRVWNCDELEYTVVQEYGLPREHYFNKKYPACVMPGADEASVEAVKAFMLSRYTVVQALVDRAAGAGPENIGTSFYFIFDGAMWLSLLIHSIVVEVYIHLTPGEDARLRQYSYQRQMEAGNTRHPGNAGTTRDRLGDSGAHPFKFD